MFPLVSKFLWGPEVAWRRSQSWCGPVWVILTGFVALLLLAVRPGASSLSLSLQGCWWGSGRMDHIHIPCLLGRLREPVTVLFSDYARASELPCLNYNTKTALKFWCWLPLSFLILVLIFFFNLLLHLMVFEQLSEHSSQLPKLALHLSLC